MTFPPVPECTREEWLEASALTAKYAPLTAPPGWRALPPFPRDSILFGVPAFRRTGDRLAVLVTASRFPGDPEPDRVWLHVSLSRPGRIPTYEDMAEVKRAFIGKHNKAIQVFPEEERHINIHPNCLHMWSCMEGGTDGLPDFGAFGTI